MYEIINVVVIFLSLHFIEIIMLLLLLIHMLIASLNIRLNDIHFIVLYFPYSCVFVAFVLHYSPFAFRFLFDFCLYTISVICC